MLYIIRNAYLFLILYKITYNINYYILLLRRCTGENIVSSVVPSSSTCRYEGGCSVEWKHSTETILFPSLSTSLFLWVNTIRKFFCDMFSASFSRNFRLLLSAMAVSKESIVKLNAWIAFSAPSHKRTRASVLFVRTQLTANFTVRSFPPHNGHWVNCAGHSSEQRRQLNLT